MADTDRVVRVSSNIHGGVCEECAQALSGDDDFEMKVNHYLREHGYRLLHVGQETTDGPDGKPWQLTVAVLGKHLQPGSWAATLGDGYET